MSQATFTTHEVFNQSPPFEDIDLHATSLAIGRGGRRQWRGFGTKRAVGVRQALGLGRDGGAGPRRQREYAKLRTFDSRGNRRDEVEFHPAYHELMAHSAHAVHNSTWNADGKPAGGASEVIPRQVLAAQVETGHLCPITMTTSVAALAEQPDLLAKDHAGARHAELRSGVRAVVDQARHDARHGHDREAGRHRRPLQHDARGTRRGRLPYHRA